VRNPDERGRFDEAEASCTNKKSIIDAQKAAMAKLLESHGCSLDDKLATVKTAHHIDKDRVQSAFRRLMTGG
jgi:hypothetical protein